MQLVAYGAQDVYLTGNPEITFWKVVYRRHTNFSVECIEHTLQGNPNFGRKCSTTVIRNGDLAYRIYLHVVLDNIKWFIDVVKCGVVPPFSCQYTPPMFAWVRRLGFALIRYVKVEIGGSEIDKQYGTWMDIWYELTHDVNQDRGFNHMIGDVDELTRLDSPDANGNVKGGYGLYVPLFFWFNRNSGLALPLIALQYHEVRLEFEFEDVNKLIVWKSDSNGVVPDLRGINMKEASILVDYVYLDAVERARFAQVGHEYLIEQVQFTGDETITGNSRELHYKAKLNFNHPTKELIWAIKNTAFVGDDRAAGTCGVGHRFLAYTNHTALWHSVALQDAANNLANNMFRFTTCPPTTCGSGLPLADLTLALVTVAIPNPVQSFDLCTSVNGHKIRVNVFVANNTCQNLKNLEINRYPLYSGAPTPQGPPSGFNYTDYLDEISVNVDQAHGGLITATVIAHHLSLTDISVPLDIGCPPNNLIDARFLSNNLGNPYDIYVIQPFNFGLRLDGTGNPVATAGLQLNGHERFDVRSGAYFNYVQPYQHHTSTPSDGINVYSFALHPEQHQPSGSANLSRIDNTVLILHIRDPLRFRGGICHQLILDLNNSKLYVYALSYNILRIMSGMGGLAYSN
jgi:Large eukaryotic DNA virus major capsid protein.